MPPAFWSLSAQASKVLFNLLGLVIFSRLILPSDYGEFLVLSAILIVLVPFLDFALTPIYVSRTHVTDEIGNLFFTINATIAIICVIVLLSYFSLVYRGNIQTEWVVILAAGILFSGFSQQKMAKLIRNSDFFSLFLLVFISQFSSFFLAIVVIVYFDAPVTALCIKFGVENTVFYLLSVLVFDIKNNWVSILKTRNYLADLHGATNILFGRCSEAAGLFFERYLLGYNYSVADVGGYYRAVDLGRVADFFVREGLTGVAINYYREGGGTPVKKVIFIALFFVGVAIFSFIFISMFGSGLILWLLGDEWAFVAWMSAGIALYAFFKIIQNTCFILFVCLSLTRRWLFANGVFYVFYCLVVYLSLGADISIILERITVFSSIYWSVVMLLCFVGVFSNEKN